MGVAFAKAFGLAVALLALNLLFGTMTAFPAEVGVAIEIAPGQPPALRQEVVPPPPPGRAERVIWVHGRWRWAADRARWVWVPGHYVEKPRREAVWVDGHWDRGPHGWVWVEGEWH